MLRNATPKRYRTNFIEPGLVDYSTEGVGKVLVSKEALDRMLSSFVGKPVFLYHQEIEADEAFNEAETVASGIVSDVGYDDTSGWYYADMMIWDKEVQDAIDSKGFTVSCAYDMNEFGEGGKYHNIEYDKEVIDGEYVHMAIVDNPRYESATIIQNSKPKDDKGGVMKFKLFNKKLENEEPKEEDKKKDEEMQNMDSDSIVELEDGTQIPVSELVQAYKAKKETEKQPVENLLNMDDEIDVDGEKVKVSDMVNAYKNKCNAEPAQDEEAEDVVDEKKQMQNSVKKPNENFKKLQNAVNMEGEPVKPKINTRDERLARGKERYSLKGDK